MIVSLGLLKLFLGGDKLGISTEKGRGTKEWKEAEVLEYYNVDRVVVMKKDEEEGTKTKRLLEKNINNFYT